MRRLPLILLLAMVLPGCGKEPVEPLPPPSSPAPAEEITTLLLPILIGEQPVTISEREWTTMTIMDWPEPEVLWVGIGGRAVAVKPGASRPPEFRRNDLTGTLLLLPLRAASRLRVDHFLRDQESGATVQLPVPRASEVEEGEAEITLKARGGAETILRIYDLLPTADGRVSVSVGRGEHRTLLGEYPLVQAAPAAPHLAEISLPKQAGAGPVTLTLTPSATSSRLWVLLIELDHLSGDIRVQSSSSASSP